MFCAIRPEVKYSNYTFSTLGFAKNASVIKLNPKKVRPHQAAHTLARMCANLDLSVSLIFVLLLNCFVVGCSCVSRQKSKATTAATPAERKLMEELDKLKLMMEELTKQNEALRAAAGGVDMSALTAKTASGTDRQAELEKALQEKKTLEAKLAEQEAESRRRQEALQKQQIELKEELAALQEAGMEGLDEAVKKNLLDKQRKLEEQLEAERAKFQSVSAYVFVPCPLL